MPVTDNVKPLVSVIMPAYNAAGYIAESVRSVMQQSYDRWELIVVNDGSHDTTEEIVQNLQKEDNRIKYYFQENKGQYTARNLALQVAQGELVAFLDSDDIWFPDKLEVSVSELLSSDHDLFFTDTYTFYQLSDLEDTSSLKTLGVSTRIYEGEAATRLFIEQNRIPILTVLTKRDILIEAGGFPSFRIAEDYCLWLELLFRKHKFRSIDTPLSAYRLREQSIMAGVKNESKEVLDMMMYLSSEYPQIRTDYKRQIKHWLRQFIKHRLDDTNSDMLKQYFVFFNQSTMLIKCAFSCRKVLPLSAFRKILKTVL
ncbi:teichuronic acid biosynthesis glycosyltransferase TuaG [Dysgonomonas sp. PFB1-18]|uniref:glycosyltransferase family 2 protein n=1 Tax=unclassified Dysgonomonas TaxID=2630389 RepID=UPI0024743B29|nr:MULTISPECIES: glycosyltransferase family 2 protein [unclassified Dysgonomonas]MDH6309644.1 teichuronic acid biosynthesis glycosyltransferase TuaG [Dysgonomonas sp. PF1-14]MDH6339348.1 teichuronic acid biosynthesis glycosyltransferase TuaG [Dysgonomonas sp. PF1-16]MDH6380847.1 teichuronic acid biosynthesis glycosyltransferase TuaG [Dysgonomonas sp. PFB1-18]MDH6398343.1 teichuronic acid biosynthesis glycosyltransferase TuaG [Dysgonomonas sp. PF1-23]